MYTGTRPGLTPAIRAEKGWRGRRELAPRRSATQLGAFRGRIWTDTYVKHTVRTTTTATTKVQKGCRRFALPFLEPSAVAIMSGERDAGSARRRRERRLRSWLRHERMTVAAELSAALHRTRDGEREQYVGLPAQKSDSEAVVEEVAYETHAVPRGQHTPPPGSRPAPLPEVAGPLGMKRKEKKKKKKKRRKLGSLFTCSS